MARTTSTEVQQSARRHLATISAREVEAMQAVDPDTLSGLLTMIGCLTNDADTLEHAGIIVASLLPGAQSPMHAARAAVRIASRAVALSRQLDQWDMFGDMTEDVATTIEDAHVRTGLPRYAPDPASSPMVRTTYADLVATACAMLPEDDGSELRAACVAYLAHARTCTDCTDASAQRVTLAGVRAHADGRGAEDSTYHSERRAVLRALRSVPTFAEVCQRIGDPAPLARAHEPHASVAHGDTRPESTRDQMAPVRTVTHNGTPRAMTDAERDALHVTRERMARHAGEEYRGGTHGPSAHDRSATTGMLRSFAVAPSPRKRAGTGSTGPTLPAW